MQDRMYSLNKCGLRLEQIAPPEVLSANTSFFSEELCKKSVCEMFECSVFCSGFLLNKWQWASIFVKLLESTTNWHLPSTSLRIKSGAAAVADLHHSLKGV